MKLSLIGLATLCLALGVGFGDGARILAIVPIPSISHQIAYQALWKTLSTRGHEVVLVTANAITDAAGLTNLTQFEIREAYKLLETIDFTVERKKGRSWMDIMETHILHMSKPLAELVFSHPKFKRMYAPNSGKKFDVVIVEAILTPACYAFGHRFDAPVIGAYSLGLMQNLHYALGNPVLSSHPSNYEIGRHAGINLSFWRRLRNYVVQWHHLLTKYDEIYYKPQDEIIKKYLGDAPSARELEKNLSIVLSNEQEEISFARPAGPNVITFGSLHVTANMKPLPKTLKEFIDNAPNGIMYVSFGTNVRTENFSKDMVNKFFDVFSNLPVKVVWKFNGTIPKSDNIYTAPWFSQQSVLAHPKTKLFLYQGGVQSTEEAVNFGVPLVGVPVLADQDMQINKLVSIGVCKYLDIFEITRESLDQAIREVLTDKRYKENMTKLSKLIKDKPMTQMENVIWWIEYVIRNKGAPHLRSSLTDETWPRLYDTDIIAFLSVAAFSMLLIAVYIVYKTLIVIMSHGSVSVTSEKKKIS